MTSDTNYPELVHTSQIKGTVLHETSLTSDTAAVQGCTGHPHFYSAGSRYPFKCDSLKWLTQNSGECCTYYCSFIISKMIQIRSSHQERHMAQSGRVQTWSICWPQWCVTLLAHQYVTGYRLLLTRMPTWAPMSRVLTGVSLCKRDWWDHCPCGSHSRPSFFWGQTNIRWLRGPPA